MPKDDLVGRTFGRLTVVAFAGYPSHAPSKAQWKCDCSCGSRGLVVYGYNLKNGNTLSCSCVKIERTKQANSTHGESRSRLYNIYCGMLSRCYQRSNARYNLYGARGIKVVDRWLGIDGYLHFKEDMGRRPSIKHSVERKDNNGPYGPKNCVWATQKQQCRNKRTNKIILGLPLVELCEKRKIPYSRTAYRLSAGWTVAEALNLPRYVRP
jgi:hypothetical protein